MNLSLLLDMVAEGLSDRTLLGRRDSGLTAARLRGLAIAGAQTIRAVGAEAVVYLGVNGPMLPIALFAAARADVPLVPLNYRLGSGQLSALLAHHPGALGIAGDSAMLDVLRAGGINSALASDWLRLFTDRMPTAEADEDFAASPAEASRPAAIIYTSGTTSAPKGVHVKHENLVSYVFNTVEFGAADTEDAALVSMPPYHIAAIAGAITNAYAGRRTFVLDQFSPARWLEEVREQRITHALVVPTMLARIMAVPDHELDVPSLRSLAYGGAAMPARVVERALLRWPHVDFVNAYGLTETSSTIAVLGPQEHRAAIASSDPHVRARLSAAGRAVPGIELEIRDGSGAVLSAGAVGRIWVRGEQVSADYAGAGPAVDERGFFDTRDEGYLDGEGYLFVGGRSDDTIIRGGENIAPAEIEEVLLSIDDVIDAVAVGVPDDEWGHRIEAVVVLGPGATATGPQLREQVAARLRSSKSPDRIAVWPELPRTETGKIIRREIVAALTAAAAG